MYYIGLMRLKQAIKHQIAKDILKNKKKLSNGKAGMEELITLKGDMGLYKKMDDIFDELITDSSCIPKYFD